MGLIAGRLAGEADVDDMLTDAERRDVDHEPAGAWRILDGGIGDGQDWLRLPGASILERLIVEVCVVPARTGLCRAVPDRNDDLVSASASILRSDDESNPAASATDDAFAHNPGLPRLAESLAQPETVLKRSAVTAQLARLIMRPVCQRWHADARGFSPAVSKERRLPLSRR